MERLISLSVKNGQDETPFEADRMEITGSGEGGGEEKGEEEEEEGTFFEFFVPGMMREREIPPSPSPLFWE